MPITPEVTRLLQEPSEKIATTLEVLKGMKVPEFETPEDADAALQSMLMMYVSSLQRAVIAIAEEVDRLGAKID
jgi:hypothetical protein